MFKQLFRVKCNGTDWKSIRVATIEATGEDFFQLEEEENPEEFIKKAINEGFIEFENGDLIVNGDVNE